MKCFECGVGEMASRKETFRYECDVAVDLVDVTVWRCPHCGEFEVEIPRLAQLHRVIAQAIAVRPVRLTGPEIRFLRTYIGWSGRDFARRFNKSPETISRWENGKRAMDPMADVQLRLWVVAGPQTSSYDGDPGLEAAADSTLMKQLVGKTLALLEQIGDDDQPAEPAHLRLFDLDPWTPQLETVA